jgi:predicted transcriptional regulator
MAQRNQSDRLTLLETEIMNVLWEISHATAQTVRQRLKRELAYTTAQTMLNVKEARDGND